MFIHKLKLFNRRQSPRHEPAFTIPLSCVYEEAGRSVECVPQVINISKGGIFFVFAEQKIYPGKHIEIHFKLPGSPLTQSIRGVVTRTYRRHKEKDYYTGVRFENPDPQPVRALYAFLTGLSP